MPQDRLRCRSMSSMRWSWIFTATTPQSVFMRPRRLRLNALGAMPNARHTAVSTTSVLVALLSRSCLTHAGLVILIIMFVPPAVLAFLNLRVYRKDNGKFCKVNLKRLFFCSFF
jgi:hypothetical protein